jgi:hypothetical protein
MSAQPRWPVVIGTIGLVLGALSIIDKLDDLMTLWWTAEDWEQIFAPAVADLIVRSVPPVGWRVVSVLVELALAALLVFASLGLRRRSPGSVPRLRLWAWLAVAWAVVAVGLGGWWLQQRGGLSSVTGVEHWQGYAVFGLAVAGVLLIAFPVFVLAWLARPDVRAEFERWSRGTVP